MKPFWATSAFAACLGSTSMIFGQQIEPPQVKTDKQAPVAGQKEVPALNKDLAALVEGNNQFAFDLYRQLGQKPGNKFFSPYSISSALGMTYAGARGNTAKEMAQTLHLTLDNERLHPAFGDLIRMVQGADKKRNYHLAVANGLWGNKTGLSLDPKFMRITQTDYEAGFQFVDFVNNPESARGTINGWVENKTKGKIKDVIGKGIVPDQTALILVNAIYFKADWTVMFPKAATRPSDFTIPGTPAFKVPMMHMVFDAGYMETAGFDLAIFTYKDNEVSMVVILPKKIDGLAEVEKHLSAKVLERSFAMARVRKAELDVKMPKFKITEEFELGSELAKMGMKDASNKRTADFTGMQTNSQNPLFISAVAHRAFVDINEEGTEAAAATFVRGSFGPWMSRPTRPIRFHADHPFIFFVRHNATGSILFMGRISDPREK